MKHYVKLMRVHHYIKNLLVFAALACSGQLLCGEKLAACVAAFLAFCMVSSAIYVINDICDVQKDRLHPTKCRRPIAAGLVSVRSAWILAAVLLVLGAVFNFLTGRGGAGWLLVLYFGLNLAYSFGLKNVPIVDITILVSGFLIRILYGARVSGISISNWLYLTVLVLSFYFALGKRRNELRSLENGDTRAVLRAYPPAFLDKSMGMCLTLANVFYALWSTDAQTLALYNNRRLSFTVPIVLLITLRYSFDVEGDSSGDPVEVLLHDKPLLGLCALYLVMMLGILYL